MDLENVKKPEVDEKLQHSENVENKQKDEPRKATVKVRALKVKSSVAAGCGRCCACVGFE
jgi:hypothetical protein